MNNTLLLFFKWGRRCEMVRWKVILCIVVGIVIEEKYGVLRVSVLGNGEF